MLFDTLALISLIVFITLLKRFVNIFPSLMACFIRSKESINLEASVKLSHDRDIQAFALLIPFILIVTQFRLYDPSFMHGLTENARIGINSAVFLVYILLRGATSHLFRPGRINPKTYGAARKSAYSFFIILTIVLIATGGTLSFLDLDPADIKTAMIWISIGIYLIFIIRKFQIFTSSCSIFTAFLYLCALELIPTGILTASAVIFKG